MIRSIFVIHSKRVSKKFKIYNALNCNRCTEQSQSDRWSGHLKKLNFTSWRKKFANSLQGQTSTRDLAHSRRRSICTQYSRTITPISSKNGLRIGEKKPRETRVIFDRFSPALFAHRWSFFRHLFGLLASRFVKKGGRTSERPTRAPRMHFFTSRSVIVCSIVFFFAILSWPRRVVTKCVWNIKFAKCLQKIVYVSVCLIRLLFGGNVVVWFWKYWGYCKKKKINWKWLRNFVICTFQSRNLNLVII